MNKKTIKGMESGEIIEQKCWQYIKEVNSTKQGIYDLVAIEDCKGKYTYRQMYGMWEKYARVFSALGITGERHARAAVDGTPCAETSFAFFGLNMTGASASMIMLSSDKRLEKLKEQIKRDQITDLILTDYDVDKRFLKRVIRKKHSMGLNNVIVLHVPVEGDFVWLWDVLYARMNHIALKEVPGAFFMEDLIEKYCDHPISYADEVCCDSAVVIHTSGTTEGVPKSVPLSDRAVNESLRRYYLTGIEAPKKGRMTHMVSVNMSAGAMFMGMMRPLANGGKLITLPMISPGLSYFYAAVHYRLTNIIISSPELIDFLMLMPFRPDLSSVQTVNLVGSFSSADSKKKCRKFFRQCGAHANILVGYGLSEAELGITISDPESNDESVGYLLPGVKGKLWNGRGCGMGCDMLPCTKEDDSPKTIAPVKLSEEIENRLQSGEITEQKSWKFIKELNSYSGERLDAIALSDSSRDYTYRQIFDLWDKYAAVFSALDICSKNQSRAAMVGTCAVEPISALYALNMTGVSVSMIAFNDFNDIDIWKKIVTAEGITDALLNDVDSEPDFIRALVKEKEELGIRNIIVQNIAIAAGDDFSIADEHAHRKKQRDIRKIGGILFMDDLLKKHASHPVCFGSEASSEAAVIIHTSGTVSGIHKPVPHSDAGFNEAVARLVRDERFKSMMGRAVTVSGMDMSNSYALMDQIHLVLAFGGRLYVLPGKRPGMEMLDSLIRNKANIAFFAGLIFDVLLRLPFSIDLSALEFIIVGGSYISANAKKRYDRFLARNGAKTRIMIGYGLSEAGAACILAPEDRKDNAIGYPLSGVKVKLYDENDGKYFDPEDGPRTGVLHISSKSVSNGRIDDTVFFETEEIDGERYLNTYDLVRVGRDGALYYTGRMNKYFVNNEGVRFDAGLVETAVSAEAGIEACGLAPEYEKVLHDTIPVLYVKAATDKRNSLKTVREALINVFVRQNIIEKTNLPSICVITDDIPLNEMGKVDTYRIRKGESKGRRFSVMPVKRDGLLISVDLVPQAGDEGGPGFGFGVPEELEDSVINMRGSFKKR